MEKITAKIAALPPDSTFFSLEFFPPKTQTGLSNLQARLERMSRALRPLFINVTWGAGGSTAGKSLELAEICQRQLGLTTCLHLTCTNMSQRLIDDTLEKAKAIGVRNILALRGDPPRKEEYGLNDADDINGYTNGAEERQEFNWAVDLVRYIRRKYGDYFCIGVAAYPEGHSDQSHPDDQDPKHDLPYLIEKTKAGVDFLMTQLFYDVKAYERFEDMLRNHPGGVFKTMPILPGLMPIQSYQILRRTTKLSHAKLPPDVSERIEAVRGDDDAVKRVGIDILSEIVEELKSRPSMAPGPKGFHFYTLNLEKAVSQIIERCGLIRDLGVDSEGSEEEGAVTVTSEVSIADIKKKQRRRLSSINSNPRNRVVVTRPSSSSNKGYEALEHEAGIPTDGHSTRATTLQISEGHGSLGREATWDDFPNGRWGDARSPAFGEIDGYGPTLHASFPQAIKMWGYPVTKEDISEIFKRHIAGELEAIPWSEEGFLPETSAIKDELLKINDKGWWTVASQPAVNGVKSSDETFGWGPRGGFCFQKPFVELFLPSQDFDPLQKTLQDNSEITYFAGNAAGEFASSDAQSVNPVTWGTFPSKEIVTPTIIEKDSFVAWREEAFSIWTEWQRLYSPQSASAKLLGSIKDDYWLINIIHHDYSDRAALWKILIE